MIERTPGPLKVFTTPDGLKIVGIGALDGEGICDAGFGIWRWNDAVGLANAEFLVRAWNAHDDMLAALKELEEFLDNQADVDDGRPNDAMRHLVEVRAAIAKAEP